MDIPAELWYQAISKRRSRRYYDQSKSISNDVMDRMQSVCDNFRPFNRARAVLVNGHCNEVFTGIIGSYGKIKCAKAFVAFVGDLSCKNVQEEVGYTGQGIILEATALNLASCWVGGFFKSAAVRSLAKIGEQERVMAVTPIGYVKEHETLEEQFMAGFGRNHNRKPLSTLVTGLQKDIWPSWISASLEAARLSPSAINRQPWGFEVNGDSVLIKVRTPGPDFNVSKRLDCGIAMLNFEVASQYNGVKGTWSFLEDPLVARFTPYKVN
jgi:nitroreductase